MATAREFWRTNVAWDQNSGTKRTWPASWMTSCTPLSAVLVLETKSEKCSMAVDLVNVPCGGGWRSQRFLPWTRAFQAFPWKCGWLPEPRGPMANWFNWVRFVNGLRNFGVKTSPRKGLRIKYPGSKIYLGTVSKSSFHLAASGVLTLFIAI